LEKKKQERSLQEQSDEIDKWAASLKIKIKTVKGPEATLVFKPTDRANRCGSGRHTRADRVKPYKVKKK
jgi:delta 1-pyrroline-5-carboxylate dehydrogenase